MEIERKYLISDVPNEYMHHPSRKIRQGYLAVSEDGTEVRVRDSEDDYSLTVKGGEGLQRTEIELTITRAQFDRLWPLTQGRRVVKQRYYIPHEQFTIELDLYADHLKGLMTAEIEFPNLVLSRSFNPPDWFGAEITEDSRYKNKNLALHGVPEDG